MSLTRLDRHWLDQHWLGAGCVLGVALVALLPVFALRLAAAETIVLLNLIVYIAHQVEEHTGDRFRRWVNRILAGGHEALTVHAVMIINVVLVWIFDGACLVLAALVHPSFALGAAYLAVINALIHLVGAAVTRSYNPGLWTALLLLLPVGMWSISVAGATATPLHHAVAAGAVIVLHAGIVLHFRRRAAAIGAHAHLAY